MTHSTKRAAEIVRALLPHLFPETGCDLSAAQHQRAAIDKVSAILALPDTGEPKPVTGGFVTVPREPDQAFWDKVIPRSECSSDQEWDEAQGWAIAIHRSVVEVVSSAPNPPALPVGARAEAVGRLIFDLAKDGRIEIEDNLIVAVSGSACEDIMRAALSYSQPSNLHKLQSASQDHVPDIGNMVSQDSGQSGSGSLAPSFQSGVKAWMAACFGDEISSDRVERGDRLLEEVLELLQSGGYDPARVPMLTEYVYGRPIGEPAQEVGGVMVCVAAYCLAFDLDMHDAGDVELARVWTKVEQIREKQKTKPKGSPLPVPAPPPMGDQGALVITEEMVERAAAVLSVRYHSDGEISGFDRHVAKAALTAALTPHRQES